MNVSPLLDRKGVKIWPLAVMMLTILLVVFGLHGIADKKEDWNLTCRAALYKQGSADDIERSVKLKVRSKDGEAVISYDYFQNKQYQGSIRMYGEITDFEVSSLILHIRVTRGEVVSDDSVAERPYYLQKILEHNLDFLERVNQGMTFTLRMSEMDLKQGFAILNFTPGNNIWACDIQAD
ncbi:hypothetical protein L2725_07180 [Shewanella corallii]|uniref:DUF4352 domain-containing protein n=1 Tax=Shewanella corallii TaxID=560080 RepID=A0ABT0N611_9GAMM|nr:hypothetical protein [Shewanella corallii]MCL2913570.1 hypothetical protein [Shewanella corallii]